ncbi:MAG: TlyA family RNA methyltransferase [Deltaproteobacteria bacterium]|nr:TlyA family RNA methyltransferase [Deltaproteobacteria bacterium]
MKKLRLDILLSEKIIAGQTLTRSRASSLIIECKVTVNGKICSKPGTLVNIESDIDIIKSDNPYVSRGGIKLKNALNEFNVSVKGCRALDVGASTGGFTDCLLKEGCELVYCVDVGYGQLDYNLRNNEKVINYEKTHIKDLGFDKIKEKVNICVIDASFIPLKKVLPYAVKFLKDDGLILALIKPQFETGSKKFLKKGIVKDEKIYENIISDIIEFSKTINLISLGVKKSCIKGKKGNTEFFIHLVKIVKTAV